MKYTSNHLKSAGNQLKIDQLPKNTERKSFLQTFFAPKIDPDSLSSLLKASGQLPSKSDIESWIKEFDETHWLTEEEITRAFSLYDDDGSGSITREELKKVIELIGEEMSESEIEELVREADTDGDGTIDYQEFINMILQDKQGQPRKSNLSKK